MHQVVRDAGDLSPGFTHLKQIAQRSQASRAPIQTRPSVGMG